MEADVNTPTAPQFLRDHDFAGTLTARGRVPTAQSTADEVAVWRLASRFLLVDADAGEIYRADGETRAEHLDRRTAYGKVYLGRVHGRVRIAQAHRVVWIARHGLIPGMYEVNHRNGLRWDNRVLNLDLVTHAANCRHARRLPYAFAAGRDINGPDDRPTINPISNTVFAGHGLPSWR